MFLKIGIKLKQKKQGNNTSSSLSPLLFQGIEKLNREGKEILMKRRIDGHKLYKDFNMKIETKDALEVIWDNIWGM